MRFAAHTLLVLVALTRVAAARCHETSPIVGREHCHRFGSAWAHSDITGLSVGFMTSSFIVERVELPAFDDHEVVSDPRGNRLPLHAHGGPGRFTAFGYRSGVSYRGNHATLALELAGAGGHGPPIESDVAGITVVDRTLATVLDVDVAAGEHVRVGAIDLGVELAPGVRVTSATEAMPAGYSICPPGVPCRSSAPSTMDGTWFVDLRGRVELWVSRQVTVGVVAGIDLETRAPTFALAFRFHVAAYDGT